MEALLPRPFQLEMVEMSLRENIIVVMGTGTGKTFIASMRIMAELERCRPDQLTWFLAPTKVLCTQQWRAISSHLPAVKTKMLTGDDGVEYWGDQKTWDHVLDGVQLMVSTYAVLADALRHGFVSIGRLALIVFDEAHHCAKSHPANQIMMDFYHMTRLSGKGESIPWILGLTASIEIGKISEIEKNMHAVCRSPHAQQEGLADHSAPHTAVVATYKSDFPSEGERDEKQICSDSLAIHLDCFHHRSTQTAHQADCARSVQNKIYTVYEQLGEWSAQRLINELSGAICKCDKPLALGHCYSVPTISPCTRDKALPLSEKAKLLLQMLINRYEDGFSAVIFVRERIVAFLLCILINEHPMSSGLFRCAPCVGGSTDKDEHNVRKTTNYEGFEKSVTMFRQGEINVIVATSVLEEGIDFPTCRLVISFDPPESFQSYVQRRGRARDKLSEFIIMENMNSMSHDYTQWDVIESKMQDICLDPAPFESRHELVESETEVEELYLGLDTGAVLTAASAISHLYHFCSILSGPSSATKVPFFAISEDIPGQFRSTVYLPSAIHRSLRVVESKRSWMSKKAARQDAAFHAYIGLHHAGLVNDNLLPLFEQPYLEILVEPPCSKSSVIIENSHFAWKLMDMSKIECSIYRSRIRVFENGVLKDNLGMALFTNSPIPIVEGLELHWDDETTFKVTLEPAVIETFDSNEAKVIHEAIRRVSALLLQCTEGTKFNLDVNSNILYLTPDIPLCHLEDWFKNNVGSEPWGHEKPLDWSPVGFIRHSNLYNIPYIFKKWIDPSSHLGIRLECAALSRRRNMLFETPRIPENASKANQPLSPSSKLKVARLVASACSFDRLPWELARATLFIKPILNQIERFTRADRLLTNLLPQLDLLRVDLVALAITASSTNWPTNYQRLECMGDSVLKFAVSVYLFATYPLWHEGYLSSQRSRLVSNNRLEQAARDIGIARYIWTEQFSGRQIWNFSHIDRKLNLTIPHKVMSDVIEALIGVGYVCGDMPLVYRMLNIFLPEVHAGIPDLQSSTIHYQKCFSSCLEAKIECLLGYSFKNKGLLWEALTHPSWQKDTSTDSYQRLEFLGDAVLDMVVTRWLFRATPNISEGRITQIRQTVVNADFLAFTCMEFALPEYSGEVLRGKDGEYQHVHQRTHTALWEFMRHHVPYIVESQCLCSERHSIIRPTVIASLTTGSDYPWAALSQLGADKFYSDIVESILGGIYVDSNGDLDICEALLQRMEIISYMNRTLEEEINLEHPKVALEDKLKGNKVDYHFCRSDSGLWSVQLTTGTRKLSYVDKCRSKTEARVRGAEAALMAVGEFMGNLN